MDDPRWNGNQQPFYPLGYVAPQQQTVQRPYVHEPTVDGAHCPLCTEKFEFDDDTTDLARGRARRSLKTGGLITVDPATDGSPKIITVHSKCLIEYWAEHEDPDGGATFWELVEERAEELVEEWLGDPEMREGLERRLADPRS